MVIMARLYSRLAFLDGLWYWGTTAGQVGSFPGWRRNIRAPLRADGLALQPQVLQPHCLAAHAGLSLGQALVDKHPIRFSRFVLTFCVAALFIVLNCPAPSHAFCSVVPRL